jgi:ribonuclease E
VQAPPEVANYLLNEKRRTLSELEERHEASIVIVADPNLETPQYEVRRIRESELSEHARPSYERVTPVAPMAAPQTAPTGRREQAAVTRITPATPAPEREEVESAAPVPTPAPKRGPTAPSRAAASAPVARPSLWQRIVAFFAGTPASEEATKSASRNAGSRRGERADPGPRDRCDDRRNGSGGKGGPRDERARGGNQGGRDQGQAKAGPKPQPAPQPRPATPSQGQVPKPQPSPPAAQPQAQPGAGATPTPAPTGTPDAPRAPVAAAAASAVTGLTGESEPATIAAGGDGLVAPGSDASAKPDDAPKRRRGRRGGRRRRKQGAAQNGMLAPAAGVGLDTDGDVDGDEDENQLEVGEASGAPAVARPTPAPESATIEASRARTESSPRPSTPVTTPAPAPAATSEAGTPESPRVVPAMADEGSRAAQASESAANSTTAATSASQRPQQPAPAPSAPRPQPVSRPMRPQPEPRVPPATPLASAIAAVTHSQATLDELARAVFAADDAARKPAQAVVTSDAASEAPTAAPPPSPPGQQATAVETMTLPAAPVAITTSPEVTPANGDASQGAIAESASMRAEAMAAAKPVTSKDDSAAATGSAAGVGNDEPKDVAAAPVAVTTEVEAASPRERRDP